MSSDVFVCLSDFVPVLATFELLTISNLPNSALLLPVIKGGLKRPALLPTSKEDVGNNSELIFLFLNNTE